MDPAVLARVRAPVFDRALALVLESEGGWSDHPSDPGGATMRGVTLRTYAAWCAARGLPTPDAGRLRAIPDDHLRAVYRDLYWSPIRADHMAPALAYVAFDGAVNHGSTPAPTALPQILQRALRHAGRPVAVDGRIGPQTLAALAAVPTRTMVRELVAARGAQYGRLDHLQAAFLDGWMRRLAHVHERALGMLDGAQLDGAL